MASVSNAPTPPNTIGGVACETVFFVDEPTGKLGGVLTVSDRYQTAAGTSVGILQSDAEHREGQAAHQGCAAGITLGVDPPAAARVQIYFGASGVGSAATELVASSRADDVGLLDC